MAVLFKERLLAFCCVSNFNDAYNDYTFIFLPVQGNLWTKPVSINSDQLALYS